jgi:hypothetical protein
LFLGDSVTGGFAVEEEGNACPEVEGNHDCSMMGPENEK